MPTPERFSERPSNPKISHASSKICETSKKHHCRTPHRFPKFLARLDHTVGLHTGYGITTSPSTGALFNREGFSRIITTNEHSAGVTSFTNKPPIDFWYESKWYFVALLSTHESLLKYASCVDDKATAVYHGPCKELIVIPLLLMLLPRLKNLLKEILEDLKKDPESHGGPPDCIGKS
ncbi:hypothetical protein ZOSMA_265G00040 [Zostera marina]|uniref:Uncharacterized protein n=1 Tax=Zostera marina TaxID=29655 RepID=A0A0K9PEV0_ZOSMR|nr:hypothetical protein ZOSMA_265G00040 [Zostera marina]